MINLYNKCDKGLWRGVSSRWRDSSETFQNLIAHSLSITLKVPFATLGCKQSGPLSQKDSQPHVHEISYTINVTNTWGMRKNSSCRARLTRRFISAKRLFRDLLAVGKTTCKYDWLLLSKQCTRLTCCLEMSFYTTIFSFSARSFSYLKRDSLSSVQLCCLSNSRKTNVSSRPAYQLSPQRRLASCKKSTWVTLVDNSREIIKPQISQTC